MNRFTNFNQRAKHILAASCLLIMLSACGGGGSGGSTAIGPAAGQTGSTTTTTDTTGTTGTATTVSTNATQIGSLQSGTFVGGQANVAVANLSAGGTTEITVNLVDVNGNTATDNLVVNFTSPCAADGTATLGTGITSVGGQVVSTYVANGCVGSDVVRATVTLSDSTTATATGTVVVAQESIGSISFISAVPTQIGLEGTGGSETSRVTFRVLGAAGGAIQDATVNFALNSTTGGLTLSTTTAQSNSQGDVSTIVNTGSIATSVRVTATEMSTNVSTQSSQLTVSTGIPDFNSFSVSALPHNPEGLDIDNIQSTFSILAADIFNNPAPEGTSISFYAEGGAIDPFCTLDASGACSVTWRSQSPRPANGRVTILASVIGNESFIDANGNGRFDDGEVFTDLGEAFADHDENGVHDAGEFFVDFGPSGTPDGIRNPADGQYNGVLCADAATQCSTDRSVVISGSIVMSMSSSTAIDPVLLNPLTGQFLANGTTLDINTISSVVLVATDRNGNSMPGGTTVTASVDTGYTIAGTTSFTVPTNTADQNIASGTLDLGASHNSAYHL